MSRLAMKTYLEGHLATAVARLAASQNRSESAVIADAVRARFANTSTEAGEASGETQKRQLNRLEARVDALHWEIRQTKHAVFLFVRVWLEHNPPLDPEIEDSAAASAQARYERFLDLLTERLGRGDERPPQRAPSDKERAASMSQTSLFDEGILP